MKKRILLIGLTGSLILVVLTASGIEAWRYNRQQNLEKWLQTASSPFPAMTKLELPTYGGIEPNGEPSEALKAFAWKTFSEMVPPEGSAEVPKWEDHWKTKADLGLELPVLEDAFGDMNVAGSSGSMPHPIRNSFRLGIQAEVARNHKDLKLATPSQSLPTFASVLFNREAAGSVTRAIDVLSHESLIKLKRTPEFEPHSIMAKTVWTMIPMANNHNSAAKLSVTTIESTRKLPQSGSPGVNLAPRSTSGGTWIEADLTADPAPRTTNHSCAPTPGAPLPLSCLYAFVFDVTSDSIQQNMMHTILARLDEGSDHRLAVNRSCGHVQCAVALMAVHFMVRLGERDPFYQKGAPNWLFMTFWWNGKDNNQSLPGPWRYFDMNVTLPDARNICYNPYLEGVIKDTGALSNCANCHRYSAYNANIDPSKKGSKVLPGSCLGIQKVGTPISKDIVKACNLDQNTTGDPIKDIANNYSAGTVKTDFVWSMASLNGPP